MSSRRARNDEQSLREAAGASAERAAALEAEIDVKQKTLDRVQLALGKRDGSSGG
jgi:hypothetical protein